MKEIKSSNLQGAEYDEKTKKLQIKFPNGTYEYENVSPDLYGKFEATFQTDESSGRFFSAHIRKLKYRKL
jgi:hypothetical protein